MKIIISLFLYIILLTSSACIGQNLSNSDKVEVTKALIPLLKDNYVLQDSVTAIVFEINERLKSQDFAREHTPDDFSLYLTNALREITKDAHFGFLYNPELSALLNGPVNGSSEALNQQLNTIGGGNAAPASKKNFYFKKAEILNGNIGYLKLEQIPMLEESKSTLDAAMAFLSNSDAFILDLRGNRGGAGGFIPYLMSYFFPGEKVLLYKREMPAPAWDSVSYHYTHKELPGKRIDKIPVYILTDQLTGSAATNLAYTMQSFGKAVIVGENTGSGYRGAHSASLFSLPKGFVALIPIGRVVNAKTNTNWRMEGVIPDVETKSSKALIKAQLLALEKLIENESNKELKADLKAIYQEKNKPPKEANIASIPEALDKYIGTYEGNRTIWFEDNELMYLREGGMPLLLKYKEEHLYKITLPSNTPANQPLPYVKFNFNDKGKVDNITLVFDEGKNTQGPFKKLSD